jgi:hypothetical protein
MESKNFEGDGNVFQGAISALAWTELRKTGQYLS